MPKQKSAFYIILLKVIIISIVMEIIPIIFIAGFINLNLNNGKSKVKLTKIL